MKFRIIVLAVALGCFSQRISASPPPATLAEGAKLSLTDGRTIANWKIKRQSAASVFVLTANGIVTVDKRLLPEELRSLFPYDPATVAKEAEQLAAADLAGKAHGAEIEAKRKAEYDKRVAKAAPEMKRQADLLNARPTSMAELGLNKNEELSTDQQTQLDMMQESFANGPDGLYMTQMKVNEHAVQVGVYNFTKTDRTFAWRKTRGRLWDKSIVEPTSVALTTPSEDPAWLVVSPGKTKFYTIEFGDKLPTKLRMFALANEHWLTSVGGSARQ